MGKPLLFDPLRFPTPQARIEEAVDAAKITNSMLLIVWSDTRGRKNVLNEVNSDDPTLYFECQKYRTTNQFWLNLAVALEISMSGAELDATTKIIDYLQLQQTVIVFDHADRLTKHQFRSIRNIYDQTGTRILIAGNTERVFTLANDIQEGGQFASRCLWCDANNPTCD